MMIDLENPDAETLHRAARVVREGGLVLYPTDTIYGLGCDARRPDAVRKLLSVKGRPEGKGMLVLIRSIEQVTDLVTDISSEARTVLERFWPGPLTVLLSAVPGLPESLLGSGSKIGLRWPANRFLQRWLDLIDLPLVSTSANPSGRPYDGSPEVLRKLFADHVDLLLDAGELPPSRPSTVLDLSTLPFRIVRPGAGAGEVQSFLKSSGSTIE